jgi:cytochrome c1
MSSLPAFSNRRRLCLMAVLAAIFAGAVGLVKFNSNRQRWEVARVLTRGDPSVAPPIMRRYGCSGCHTISGVPGADGQVGGALEGIRERVYIGGVANNTADNLVQWIVSPQSFSPHSAMPTTGISEAEARDVAAYLYGH